MTLHLISTFHKNNIWTSSISLGNTCLICVFSQCGAGLQAAGGQAAATDEEALSHRGNPLPGPALLPGGLLLHAQTQVQSRLQEACSLETLVPLKNTGAAISSPLQDLCICLIVNIWLFICSRLAFSHISVAFYRLSATDSWILPPSEVTGYLMWIAWKCAMSWLPKMDSELFCINFFKRGVKLHHGNIFGDQQGGKTNLISFNLFAYIFLASRVWVLLNDNYSHFYSPDGTFFFFFVPASRRGGWLIYNTLRTTSTAYHLYHKAQLTLIRIHFLTRFWLDAEKLDEFTNCDNNEDFRNIQGWAWKDKCLLDYIIYFLSMAKNVSLN